MTPFCIIEIPQTASTQTLLIEEDEKKSFGQYTVIFTTNQTAGKGQGTNIWESEKGKNLSFSLLLEPIFLNPSEQFLITQFVSLAIVDTLKEYLLGDVHIKWPNDIYIGKNKICGILIQNKIIGYQITTTYIGIGININQTKFSSAPNPTSFALEKGEEYNLREVLDNVLKNIFHRYKALKDNRISEIKKEYLSLLLFKDHYRKYFYKDKEIMAKILNVNSFGHLILQLEDNTTITCELKELQFVFS